WISRRHSKIRLCLWRKGLSRALSCSGRRCRAKLLRPTRVSRCRLRPLRKVSTP
ncbi:MAG: hypothetical protein AVDCRST_MAG91-1954, partial [uncultured Sphingomonadaceae bacterium]